VVLRPVQLQPVLRLPVLLLELLQVVRYLLALLWQDQCARKLAHHQKMLIEVFVILVGL
jgi:hypothetical protein